MSDKYEGVFSKDSKYHSSKMPTGTRPKDRQALAKWGSERQEEAKRILAAKASSEKKAQDLAKRQADVASADVNTVSGRIKKAVGAEGLGDEKMQDVVKGAQFGEAVIGEGLGRMGDDDTIKALEAQAAELAKGFSSEEMQARKEKGLEAITSGTQAQSRAAQAALARSGVKGQAAGSQLGQIALGGVQARGNLERDLIIANREAQMQGFQTQAELTTGIRQFDISQAAKEKDIALQAGLGFAGLGATERGAKAATEAQVKAAKASKSSCFIEGTEILMEDGSLKKIEDIMLADKLAGGGIVYSLFKSLVTEIYEYKNNLVTGGHAVLEEGKWIRVEDSVKAFKQEGIFAVYNLSNENHRIIVNGTEFADYDETDLGSKLNDKESLEALNGETKKISSPGRRV
jgi:hypothetical protein